ncbi:DUF3718 domain-containing protein [Pseudoalteromonas sp. B131b]|uniref:DUF3718 domain-containing protein n=1 Tax=unclassified Pseudoalteromonas TaxID=194690 RepID=UPI000BBE182E|nr:DUF3718 domain-containing protein [Pseudoalteromonas sp. 1_2015MBL_MicDiv]ATG77826.1 hypothetical protein AOR04_09910 [Pseudoalteromonas sp. 1_2015MBL_MicDiv]
MNILKATLYTGLVLSAALITTPTLAAKFVAADTSPGTQACMAVASNKAYKLRATLRDLRTSKAAINKLQCNNLPITEFVSLYNLDKSANYLNIKATTRTSIKDLAKVNMPTVTIITSPK